MNQTTAIQKFYDRFSIFYPLIDMFLKPQKNRLAEETNLLPSGSLLEIGVGTGSNLSFYHRHKVTGIDLSQKMLYQARKKCCSTCLLQMNGEALVFENDSFDYVVISHVLAVTPNPVIMLEEALRVLKPNGKLFILNHFTPGNAIKYIDSFANVFSGLFCLKSKFSLNDLQLLSKCNLIKEIPIGLFSYYKLLILSHR